jgi:hypothetical protein
MKKKLFIYALWIRVHLIAESITNTLVIILSCAKHNSLEMKPDHFLLLAFKEKSQKCVQSLKKFIEIERR